MTWNELPLYPFTAENGWTCVENGGETQVYAYGDYEMHTLYSDDSTLPLTTCMTMMNISNLEFHDMNDINFTISGLAIDTKDGSISPQDAWNICKNIR